MKPRADEFYTLFEQAGDTMRAAGRVLAELGYPAADRNDIARRLRDLEHEADGHTHAILRQLNERFLTPFDREDIHELASRVDDVVDWMDEVADFLGFARTGELPPEVRRQLDLVQRGTELTADALGHLRTPQTLEPCWIALNQIENEADDAYRTLLARLYGDGAPDPMYVLKTRELTGLLEECADALEHVAHVFETIAVKQR